MSHARAFAKINLGLVVGPLRADGKHEIVTLLQRIELADEITLEPADELTVDGFPEDTIVRAALVSLARAAAAEPGWRVRIDKRIPVAAGLGGGSSDAAAALELANAQLPRMLSKDTLRRVAAALGADVPFFLSEGPQLGVGDGTELTPVAIPTGYHVVLLLPGGESKHSTAAVYAAFDVLDGARGFDRRRRAFREALSSIRSIRDFARLPPNDLGSSQLAEELRSAGAFRADVSGAGPAVYGLFERADDARKAAELFRGVGQTIVTRAV